MRRWDVDNAGAMDTTGRTVTDAVAALLRAALEAAPGGILVVDAAGRAVAWNEEFLRVWGLDAGVMARPRPEERRAAAAALTADPEAFMAEADLVRRDPGAVLHRLIPLRDGRTLEMDSRPLALGDGSYGRIWSYRDVTELIRTRDERDEAARLAEAQFEGAPFGIVVVAMDGRLLRVNRRFFEITGLDPAWAALPAVERRAQLEALAKDREAAAAFNLRWRTVPDQRYAATFETTDGRYVRLSTQPLQGRDGEILGQVFFYQDVTAEEHARQTVEAQERLLRRLVEGLDAGVMVIDRERRFRLANPAALRILGLTGEELERLSLRSEEWQAVRGDGTPMPLDEFPAEVALRTGQPVLGVEMGVERGDGRRGWLVVSAAPLEPGPDGLPASVVTTFFDVTDVREAQAAKARARHLESLAALAAGVAHRLNNHLTAIMGNAWLVRSGGGLGDEQEASLREVELVAREAAALVRDLRAYAAQASSPPREVELNAAVAAALERLGAGERGRLAVVLGASLPRVEADPDGLAQAIAHLVENALEAWDGTVELRTTVLEAGQLRPRRPVRWEPAPPAEGRFVAVLVEDCGPGMGEEELARAFEPFYSTRFAGRGLGLPAALGIVRQAGGFLGLESAPGRGTLAMLLLPARS
jgi:PAS domain S-box-containing protein